MKALSRLPRRPSANTRSTASANVVARRSAGITAALACRTADRPCSAISLRSRVAASAAVLSLNPSAHRVAANTSSSRRDSSVPKMPSTIEAPTSTATTASDGGSTNVTIGRSSSRSVVDICPHQANATMTHIGSVAEWPSSRRHGMRKEATIDAVGALEEDAGVHQRVENRLATNFVGAEAALRLGDRQPESRHVEEFPLDSHQQILDSPLSERWRSFDVFSHALLGSNSRTATWRP